MLDMYTSEEMLKILLPLCLFGILPRPTDQVPLGQSFSLLLYPASVPGLYKPQGVLIPMATSQQQPSSQAGHINISPNGVYKPLNTNGSFLHSVIGSAQGPALDPAPDPIPDPPTSPPESLALQGQMPFNFPMQVYSVGQQTVIADSDSSEEGETTQVIYMIPVNVDSFNMGVMEGTEPNLDPRHLHAPTTTPGTVTPAAHAEAQGQLGVTVGPEMGKERHSGKIEMLKDRKHTRRTPPKLPIEHKAFSPAGNIRK